jgi:ribosomal protein L44E
MAESAELTTRDILTQIDRRLTRLEEDFRELRRYVDQRFAEFERKIDQRFADSEAKSDQRFTALEAKVDRTFRWTVGLVFSAWATLMVTILLK